MDRVRSRTRAFFGAQPVLDVRQESAEAGAARRFSRRMQVCSAVFDGGGLAPDRAVGVEIFRGNLAASRRKIRSNRFRQFAGVEFLGSLLRERPKCFGESRHGNAIRRFRGRAVRQENRRGRRKLAKAAHGNRNHQCRVPVDRQALVRNADGRFQDGIKSEAAEIRVQFREAANGARNSCRAPSLDVAPSANSRVTKERFRFSRVQRVVRDVDGGG